MGMIFQIGDVLIQVDEVFPRPDYWVFEECHEDYRFLNFIGKTDYPEAFRKIKCKPGGLPIQKPPVNQRQLILRCLQGGDTQEPMSFQVQKQSEDFVVVVGSSVECQFVVKGLEEKHFKFMYDGCLRYWLVQLLEDSLITENNGVYLYLVQSSEFNDKNTKPKPGKICTLMRPGMKIAFDSNVLEVVEK